MDSVVIEFLKESVLGALVLCQFIVLVLVLRAVLRREEARDSERSRRDDELIRVVQEFTEAMRDVAATAESQERTIADVERSHSKLHDRVEASTEKARDHVQALISAVGSACRLGRDG